MVIDECLTSSDIYDNTCMFNISSLPNSLFFSSGSQRSLLRRISTDCCIGLKVSVMVYSATFNNISVISWPAVLLGGGGGRTEKNPPICRKSIPHLLVRSVLLMFLVFCVVFLFCLYSPCFLCTQCCQFLWIVHS